MGFTYIQQEAALGGGGVQGKGPFAGQLGDGGGRADAVLNGRFLWSRWRKRERVEEYEWKGPSEAHNTIVISIWVDFFITMNVNLTKTCQTLMPRV